MILRVIDTETCGFAPDNQIVEVGTVDLRVDEAEGTIEKGRVWSSLVNPGRGIPAEASGCHHITDEMVRNAPQIGELALTIWDGADIYAAHNAIFDRGAFHASGVSTDGESWVCTYKGAVVVWPQAPSHKNSVLRYWLGLELADEPGAPHRALGDAYVTAALARRILRMGAFDIEGWLAISAHPVMLPRFHFGEHAGK